MANGEFVADLGSNATYNAVASLSVPVANPVPAGDTVFVFVGISRSPAEDSQSSGVTDDKGNTYQLDDERHKQDEVRGYLYRSVLSTALDTNDNVIASFSPSSGGRGKVVLVAHFEGELVKDVGVNAVGSGSKPNSGPLAVTAPRTLIGGHAVRGTANFSQTADAPWLIFHDPHRFVVRRAITGSGIRDHNALIAWQPVTTDDDYSYVGTLGASETWTAHILAYTPPDTELSDDFTGTDGEPWNEDRWTQNSINGGTTTIQDDQGRAKGAGGNPESGGRAIGRQGVLANQNITGEFTLCQLGEPCRISLWLQTSGDWNGLDNPSDGYGIRLPADSNTAELIRVVNGAEAVLDTAIWPRDVGTKGWRFRRQGSNLRFRIWDQPEPEPDTWLLSAQDTALPVDESGSFQVAYTCPTAPSLDACVDFDDISVVSDPSAIVDAAGNRIGGTGAILKPARIVRRG